MKWKSVAALLLMLTLIGSVVLFSLSPKTTLLLIPYRDVETKKVTFNVTGGTHYDVEFYLESGFNVNFTFTSTSIFVNVSLMNSENYERYRNGESHSVLFNVLVTSTSETYNGSYTVSKSDTYHLVFEAILANATVNLTLSREVLRFLPIQYRA